MKSWCPQGTMYSHMEALIECGAALTRGVTVNGVHECSDCGAWHLGQRKKIYQTCHAAGKKIFTKKEALRIVKVAKERFEAGDTRRLEASAYECKRKKGCGQWHVTSMDQAAFE